MGPVIPNTLKTPKTHRLGANAADLMLAFEEALEVAFAAPAFPLPPPDEYKPYIEMHCGMMLTISRDGDGIIHVSASAEFGAIQADMFPSQFLVAQHYVLEKVARWAT